jgi:predicted ABC-type exoprotein transport system permease subunit
VKIATIVFVSAQAIAWMLIGVLAYSDSAALDSSGLGTGWSALLKVAFIGAWVVAGCAGVVVLAMLAIDLVRTVRRRARPWEELVPTSNARVGSATAGWLRVVVMFVLWVAGSVILILLRVPDGYAVILGWLLPLAAYLVYRRRRSAGHA